MNTQKADMFDQALILARVLNTGVIMSIEKSEKEVGGLERVLKRETGYGYAALFNSFTGALHGALWGNDVAHGSSFAAKELSEQEQRFISWLGIAVTWDANAVETVRRVHATGDNLKGFLVKNPSGDLVLDFSELGFGPCAALLTDREKTWKKAERLKIFGAFDLRTMWTREEADPETEPAVQFNYRLSPLVAACVKMAILRTQNE